MKRTVIGFAVLALMLASSLAYGYPRKVMFEVLTSSTCGPCYTAHQWIDPLYASSVPSVISAAEYHMNWPAPGNDPWYAANTTDLLARRTYYGVNAIPCEVVDGDTFLTYGTQTNVQAAINARSAIPAHIWFDLFSWPSLAGDSVFLKVKAVADSAFSAGCVLHMALTETQEHWNPAAPNGETDFHYPVSKMYPSASGQTFTHSGSTTDTSVYIGRFAVRRTGLEPFQLNNISFVVWVQSTASKRVYQSAYHNGAVISRPYDFQVIYVGSNDTVKWDATAFTGNVSIQINRDYPSGTWEDLTTNTANSGTYLWTASGANATHGRMRVLEVSDPTVGDTSNADFMIVQRTTISIDPSPLANTVHYGDTLRQTFTINNLGTSPALLTLTTTTAADGFSFLQTSDPEGPPYEWIDMTSGTAGPAGDDAAGGPYTLPFSFPYFGQNRTQVWMCTNGYIAFHTIPSTNNYQYQNQALPFPDLGAFLAVFWDDLNMAGGTSVCKVLMDTENDRAVFSWEHAQRYGEASANLNFQVALYADGRIEMNYGTMSGTHNSGTIGVQNDNGTLYTQVLSDVTAPASNTVMYAWNSRWAIPSVTSLTVDASSSATMSVLWYARSFNADTVLSADWLWTGNLESEPYTLPVQLSVTAPEAATPVATPYSFAVSEAYPNPFNPTATIDFTLEQSSKVRMTVYDIMGREVTTLVNAQMDAGNHRQMINASSWATGVYFVKIHAGEHQAVRKMLLLK
jgi:hypothetical protein